MSYLHPARTLARHTAAVMRHVHLPYTGLDAFNGTIKSLVMARNDLALIQQETGRVAVYGNVVEAVDGALSMLLPFDGSGEELPAEAQASLDDAEFALAELEASLHIRARRCESAGQQPNARSDSFASEFQAPALP